MDFTTVNDLCYIYTILMLTVSKAQANMSVKMKNNQMIKREFLGDIYQGTKRDYWVYIPKQYSDNVAANLMVLQDGDAYFKADGPMHVPEMVDKLIDAGKIAPTVCVFIRPGIVIDPTLPEHAPMTQRSLEYDGMNDQYTRFLINELLPEALAGLNISQDPAKRVIGGLSSGGICAWTVAWYRSDLFGKVLSHCGSFTDIRGGGAYPSMIRMQVKKPIKMYFQSGSQDLNTKYGDWALGNKMMKSALDFKGYESHFEFGTEGHDLIHGAELLEQSLVYLLG